MNKLLRFFVFLIALSNVVFQANAQTIRYVTQSGAGTKDGSSWTNAAEDLQGAIQASAANDIVVVANGTYLPTRKVNDLGTVTAKNRNNAFVLKANVKIYGSFEGTEIITTTNLTTLLAARNLPISGSASGSILSGDFNGNDNVTNLGAATLSFASNTENAYHVVVSAGDVGSAELNGFTISGGNANGSGGISVNFQTAIDQNKGGGLVVSGSSPIITNVVVEKNMASTTTANATCGGGVYVYASKLTISNFIIRNNICRNDSFNPEGGGLSIISSAYTQTLSNGRFENNIVISALNNAYGGALNIASYLGVTLNNVVFYNNRAVSPNAPAAGGAIYSSNGPVTLNNITAYANTAASGSFFYSNNSSLTIKNSIVWNNTLQFGTGTISNSILPTSYTGMGNLSLDPQFTDATNGNFTLKRNSPAIEGGNNAYLSSLGGEEGGLVLDLAGDPRKQGKNIDIGAYEHQFKTNALHFGGSNDVITIPASTWLDLPELTLEAWFKPERQSGGNQTIFASRSSSATRFSILHSTNGIVLWNGSNSASVNLPQPFVLNRWYHLAVVLKSGAADVYINGQFLGSMAIGTGTATNLPFQLGAAVPDGSYETFKGAIDEVRIWNTVRTATQIANNFNTPLGLYNQTNLLAYFDFSEGVAGADNTGLSGSITNLVNASLNGTMVNFTKNGTASNWVEGYAMVMPIALEANSIGWNKFKLNWQAGNMPTAENYKIDLATDAAFAQPVAGSPFTAAGSQTSIQLNALTPATTYYYRAYAEKASVTGQGMLSAVQNITTLPLPPSLPGTALKFDGVNDYISLGNSPLLKPTEQLTIGVWVNRANWNVSALQTIISNTQAGGYSINIGDATLAAAGKNITALIRRGSSYITLTTDASSLTHGWHYIAITYNGVVGRLFIDGNNPVESATSGNVEMAYHATNSTLVGAEPDAADLPSGRYFNGLIDELRIYNIGLSGAEVLADMLSTTSVKPANLVAHYNFDTPTPSTRTVLDDVGTNALDGELRNFNFTATSNWLESYAMVVPESFEATQITSNKFIANWKAPDIGTVDNGYILDVATNNTFTEPIIGSPFLVNSLNKEITGLNMETTYYYRVRADKISVAGTGAPSQIKSVKVAPLQLQPDANNILYVNINVSGGTGDGTSWENAVPQLADAMKWARTEYVANNTVFDATPLKIYVAKGTYKPMYNAADGKFTTNGGRDNAFVMVKNVQLYGGFAGTETILEQRNYSANVTILSGDVNGNDVVSGSGTTLSITNNSENNYQVVVSSGAIGIARLDGFTIASAYNTSSDNNLITVNGNMLYRYYGGMSNYSSSPSISNCSFVSNSAYAGGAISSSYSSPSITNCSFVRNYASFGGGMFNNHSSSPSIVNCSFTGNLALIGGGMSNDSNSSPSIVNCIFAGNSASSAGGGIYNYSSSSPKITNTTIANNTNSDGYGRYGFFNASGMLLLQNSIVWDEVLGLGTSSTSYSLIKGANQSGTRNINATNLTVANVFKDYDNGDYTLKATSPAIAKGSNALFTGLNASTLDLVGNPRVYNYATGGSIDLGAYEYQGLGDQTISFATLDPKTTNSTDYALSATASSGLAVSYTSSNTAVAEVYQDAGDSNQWKVKIKGAGTADITASQTGNGDYNAASSIVQNLVVIEAVLPVTLISFTAKAEGSHAKLQWQTTNEQNNKSFVIYRSGDDKQFVQIGEVAATINHQPLIINNYHYVDKQPLNGNNYYKIVQIDNDGTSKELGTRPVAFNFQLSTVNLFPNPTLNKVNVTFESGKYQSLVLSNNLGRTLQQQQIGAQTEQLVIDLTLYPTGVYFIKLKAEGANVVKKIVKQ